MTNLFPMFLKLTGHKCLVVGAGPAAESKIQSLLSCGAVVHVVAPGSTETIEHWVQEKRITRQARKFENSDLDNVFLVIAASSSDAVNQAVFREADARGILCNAVDDPPLCHFYYPAVVRRGDLQIAISTGGLSPALARRLRSDLESQFGPEYGPWLRKLGKARRYLSAHSVDPERRKRCLQRMATGPMFDKFVMRQKRRQGNAL